MARKNRTPAKLAVSFILLALFIAFMFLLTKVDVKPEGVEGTDIGFASLNTFFRDKFSWNETMYKLTKYLGYLSIACAFAFGLAGLVQLIRTRSLRGVNYRILLLAAVYAVLAVLYVVFDKIVINYRPIIPPTETEIESSFPSSHTMLLITILFTGAICLRKGALHTIAMLIAWAASAVMCIGRLMSGVHWFTDIVGAVLISAAIISFYSTAVYAIGRKIRRRNRRRRARAMARG